MTTGDNDYIAFGDLILNGAGAVGVTGGYYTIERATGLAGLPNPRVTITQLAGAPGSILSEIEDAERLITLEGELSCANEGRSVLTQEMRRFKYLLSARRGEQWLTWTPEGQAQRRIKATLQNDTDAQLDMEDDWTVRFVLNFLCTSPYWEATTETSVTGTITESGQTIDLPNVGDVFAEPIIRITPTDAKGTGFAFRRWVPIYNPLDVSLIDHPVQITSGDGVSGIDHAQLVLDGKSLADGSDLRVEVDGSLVDRWLSGANTSQTKIWTNLTFQPGQSALLTEAFASGDSVASLTFDDVSGFPSAGMLLNTSSSEAFSYTARDDTLNRVTGVTRSIKTTSAGNAASGDEFVWVERDVYIVYSGNPATLPRISDTKKPIFDLATSTNVTWVYDDFGSDVDSRSGSWVRNIVYGEPKFYNTDRDASTSDTWSELGTRVGTSNNGVGRSYLYNPVGILTATFASGEKYYECSAVPGTPCELGSTVQSSKNGTTWVDEYTIPDPSAEETWENWSFDQSLTSGSLYIGIYSIVSSIDSLVEASGCTVEFNDVLDFTVLAEDGSYQLDAILTLVDDGEDQEAVRVQYVMELDQTLELDCRVAQRTVTYLKDNSNQFQARTLQSPSLRNYWFRILGHWNGEKEMQMRYDEDDVVGTTIVVSYYARYL